MIKFGLFLILIGSRGMWQADPGLLWCATFWCVLIIGEIITAVEVPRYQSASRVISAAGAISNSVVTLANGGYMPVTDITSSHSLWVVATDKHNLIFLADIYGGWSIGDFFILTGIVLAAIIETVKMIFGVQELEIIKQRAGP